MGLIVAIVNKNMFTRSMLIEQRGPLEIHSHVMGLEYMEYLPRLH